MGLEGGLSKINRAPAAETGGGPDQERTKNFPERQDKPAACPHNVSFGEMCQSCVQASKETQPIWPTVDELIKESKYIRSVQSPEGFIKHEGIKYKVNLVQYGDEKTIKEVQALMEETFGEKEVDPLDVLREAVGGTSPDGTNDLTRYRIYVARDEAGVIQSLYAGGLVEMHDSESKPNGEMMFMGSYGVTRPESQRKGIIRELYVSSMMQAAADTHAMGKKLSLVAGECTASSEQTWNAMRRNRLYLKRGDEYLEPPYLQPALDFDPKTGLPAEGAGEAAEHLQMQFVDVQPSKSAVTSAVDAMYRWCNLLPRDEFETPEAYATHREYVGKIQKEFNDFISQEGELVLLSAQEREELRSQGLVFHEHTAADHGNNGPENA